MLEVGSHGDTESEGDAAAGGVARIVSSGPQGREPAARC